MTNSPYRLAALDMDGTLLNSDHQTTEYTRQVLRRAARAGRHIALSTGRCMSELWAHLELMPEIGYVICENGACVYDVKARRAIRRVSFPTPLVERLLERSQRFDVCRQFFSGDQSYIECADDERLKPYHVYDFAGVFHAGSVFVDDLFAHWRKARPGVDKINLYFTDPQARSRYHELLAGEELYTFAGIGCGMELSPVGATKALGLEALCDHLGIPIAESMAIGDGGNDLEIMRAAGFSVAMANAIDEVRAYADAQTGDCDHDGAAKALERYMGV